MLRQDPRSQSALLEAVGGNIDAIRAEHVFAAAHAHDKLALAVLDHVFDYLSVTVANIICLLDPEMIVIGGGVSRSGDMVVKAIRQRIAGLSAHLPRLALSQLGPDAVLFGALALAQTSTGDTEHRNITCLDKNRG
jgi:glucokinase